MPGALRARSGKRGTAHSHVVADAVGNHPGVARVVLRDVLRHLPHQILGSPPFLFQVGREAEGGGAQKSERSPTPLPKEPTPMS